MTVKKGDLVIIKQKESTSGNLELKGFGLVIKGPYEEQITITSNPFPVTVVELVCDVAINNRILMAVPIDHLQRHQQKPQDAGS